MLRRISFVLALLPATAIAATTSKGVAFIGKDISAARNSYASQTNLPMRDCDPVGDGRWICASYDNPVVEDFNNSAIEPIEDPVETPTQENIAYSGDEPEEPVSTDVINYSPLVDSVSQSHDRFSGEPVVVAGSTLAIAKQKYENATALPRIDCDLIGSLWVCASFANPDLNDVDRLSDQIPAEEPEVQVPVTEMPADPVTSSSEGFLDLNSDIKLHENSLYKSGDLMILNYDSCPDPAEVHTIAAGIMVLERYKLEYGTDYYVSNGICGDLRPRSEYVVNSNEVFNTIHGNKWLDAYNDETGSIILLADVMKTRVESGAKVWILDGGPMDFTARVLRQMEASGFAGNFKNITVIQHRRGSNQQYTDPVNLQYLIDIANYQLIGDGGISDNGTARLYQNSDRANVPDVDQKLLQRFLNDPEFGAYWQTAFDAFNPDRRFNGADTVELLWALGLDSSSIADWYDFADYFVSNETRTTAEDVVFIANYENADFSSGVQGVQALPPSADNAISITSDVSRSGRYAINHTVKRSDDYISFGSWRSESNTVGLLESRYDQDDHIRYQFSVYLPFSWKVDNLDSIDAIWQWKRFSSRPDMFVLIRGSNIELRALSSVRRTVLRDYRIGEWIDLQFDVIHSAHSDGSVKMYYKYASQPGYILSDEYNGATMLVEGPTDSTYLKWGLYKPDFDLSSYPDAERSIFHDDIKVYKLN